MSEETIPSNPAQYVQQQVVDIILADSYLQAKGVESVAENRLDADSMITEALAKTGICATVLTPTINYMGQTTGNKPAGEIPELIVSVAESSTNRERADACTGLDAGIRIAEILHSTTFQLQSIRQTVDEQRGLVLTNVTFATSLTIAITQEG